LDFQNVIRSLITLLIVALASLSVLGLAWWQAPPDPLVHYSIGGFAILGLLLVASAAGLWVLWRAPGARR